MYRSLSYKEILGQIYTLFFKLDRPMRKIVYSTKMVLLTKKNNSSTQPEKSL
jgi:hypothetical protein